MSICAGFTATSRDSVAPNDPKPKHGEHSMDIITCEAKLDWIKTLIQKANGARGQEGEFITLGVTIGIIDGIISGRLTYNPETDSTRLMQ